MRVESQRTAEAGGWVHRLRGNERPPEPEHRSRGTPAALAPLDRRDRVYRHLLARLPLSRRHRAELRARGYADGEAEGRGYASLPLRGRALACKAIAEAEHLAGVPGFYTNGDYWTLAGSPGLLIPVRAPDGKIRALRLRPDDPGDGGKYRWLSSGDRANGAASGAWCHISYPPQGRRDKRVWITEGEIKADVAARHLGARVLSLPGVDLWPRVLPDVAAMLPQRGSIVLALDADWRDKPNVHAALWALALAGPAMGYETEVALWDMKTKGLDDLLTSGLMPTLAATASIPPTTWPAKTKGRRLTAWEITPAPPLRLLGARSQMATGLTAWSRFV